MTRLLTRAGLTLLVTLTVAYLILPVLVVIPMSFADSAFLTFPPDAFSTRWYQQLLDDPTWLNSALVSLRVAVLSMICAVTLGVLAAMGLVRGKYPFRGPITALLLAPIIVPYVIVGLAVYIVFLELGLTETTLGFVLVHTALAVPYVTINVAAGLAGFDRGLELASQSLGAGPISTFFRVTFPNIAASVFAGALFAFITSWDEVVSAIFLSGAQMTTLPVRIWSGVKVQVDPTVAAISGLTLFVIIASFVLFGAMKLTRNIIRKWRYRNAVTVIGANS
ncbi:ABC transporter permease [Rhodococcus sp. IEGM 1366]|uniref:ABC transporter permease n=1 Tax=Rhodococcus sp. IEGM 1366 TaxID=3082223 RepID=UPI002952FA88|nr:ABC transporter permease [Rhodococcus sp. IEGM 1366]MDV8070704.1 ABC transporter permease [Rhodococcus sp. IEGM 1366]